MAYDLIDRRARPARPVDDEADGRAELARTGLWRALGFEAAGGSPDLADHAAARLLVAAAAERIAGATEWPRSRRTASGVESPTRSTRYGAPRKPARNLSAYLLAEVLGLSLAEVAAELGCSKSSARRARLAGAGLARAFARTKLDPRRPSQGRPSGKNERPW
jgi:hypothetical protein